MVLILLMDTCMKKLKSLKKNGADLILASNVFAHADDLKLMAESMKNY